MKSLFFSFLLPFTFCIMAEQKSKLDLSMLLVKAKTVVDGGINSNKKSMGTPTTQTGVQVPDSKLVVKAFLEEVRSGIYPDKASLYMAERVLAHQMNAEKETTLQRSPEEYTDHIQEFLTLYGNYTFEITELLAEGDKVYARWKQTGTHLQTIDGFPASGQPLVEIASAVYRVEKGKIAEYWIQIDRLGFNEQLRQQASK